VCSLSQFDGIKVRGFGPGGRLPFQRARTGTKGLFPALPGRGFPQCQAKIGNSHQCLRYNAKFEFLLFSRTHEAFLSWSSFLSDFPPAAPLTACFCLTQASEKPPKSGNILAPPAKRCAPPEYIPPLRQRFPFAIIAFSK